MLRALKGVVLIVFGAVAGGEGGGGGLGQGVLEVAQ